MFGCRRFPPTGIDDFPSRGLDSTSDLSGLPHALHGRSMVSVRPPRHGGRGLPPSRDEEIEVYPGRRRQASRAAAGCWPAVFDRARRPPLRLSDGDVKRLCHGVDDTLCRAICPAGYLLPRWPRKATTGSIARDASTDTLFSAGLGRLGSRGDRAPDHIYAGSQFGEQTSVLGGPGNDFVFRPRPRRGVFRRRRRISFEDDAEAVPAGADTV